METELIGLKGRSKSVQAGGARGLWPHRLEARRHGRGVRRSGRAPHGGGAVRGRGAPGGDSQNVELTSKRPPLVPPVVPFYRSFFGGGFPD